MNKGKRMALRQHRLKQTKAEDLRKAAKKNHRQEVVPAHTSSGKYHHNTGNRQVLALHYPEYFSSTVGVSLFRIDGYSPGVTTGEIIRDLLVHYSLKGLFLQGKSFFGSLITGRAQ